MVWCIAWMLVVSDSPETLSRIDPDERDYIVANRGHSYSTGEKVRAVCVCVCVCACVRVCLWRARARARVCVCVCVCARARV